MNDNQREVPLVYPLISVMLRTTAVVGGRVVESECEEVLNMDELTSPEAAEAVSALLLAFEEYVSKVSEAAGSPQGQSELQRILDEHARPQPPFPEDPPSSHSELEALGQGTLPLN